MFTNSIAQKLNIKPSQVTTVLQLLEEGSTIPFIARYRKDSTGALDEVVIEKIQQEFKTATEFAERKLFIEKTITEQGKMTEDLQAKLDAALDLNSLEDLYLPFKQKRKTKAVTARENGLLPLAEKLLAEENINYEEEANNFINEKVADVNAALQGARDIVAEIVQETAELRQALRNLFEKQAFLKSKVAEDKITEAQKFKDYFDYSEKITNIPSHRVLAVLRGFLEGYLRMAIEPAEEDALDLMESYFIKKNNASTEHLQKAIRDSYRRLLQPSLETAFRSDLKAAADEEAITVFAENLRQLLLSAPLGNKKTLAIDPGYRTGCKLVCLSENGELLHTDLIFVHEKNFRLQQAETLVRDLVKKFTIEAIAIGDGTAGREAEQFFKQLQLGLPIFLVNEDGASIYSASEIAREEFPDKDITVRGAVSIGRRLMDPLAELVKIDPKSIGVGQYQHDVNQARLKERLDLTVMSCVNKVGVNVNTAGKPILRYVSGVSSSVAANIVEYRKSIGKFTSREQLKKVSRLGDKVFEQCAAFLRIPDAENILDNSAVHPETYAVVKKIAADEKVALSDLIGNENLLNKIDLKNYTNSELGVHTLSDIIKELKKPGLDPRSEIESFSFAEIFSLEDVKVGMEVPGMVTNITRFGAFVDIGVKQDGLVHVSEIAHKYITDPAEVLKLNQQVMVKVLEVDAQRKRIALSIKQTKPTPQGNTKQQPHFKKGNKVVTENKPAANMMDALELLKQKFGK